MNTGLNHEVFFHFNPELTGTGDSGGASSENLPGRQGPENVCQVLGTKVKFENYFTGSSVGE